MVRLSVVSLVLVVVCAVVTVVHRQAAAGRVAGPSLPAVSGAVRVSSSPLAAAWTPLPRHDTRPHFLKNVCGGGETSPGVGLPSQDHGSSLVTCRLRRLDVTAYCDHSQPTASGVWPRDGMAASNMFRFGTRLRVPGWGVVTVTDRVGWGSQLDLFAGLAPGCQQRALTWGRRELLVEVISR